MKKKTTTRKKAPARKRAPVRKKAPSSFGPGNRKFEEPDCDKAATAPKSDPPVIVCTPNVTKEKMEAIVSVSKAVYEVAKALNSTHTDVTVQDCNFDLGNGTGIALVIK